MTRRCLFPLLAGGILLLATSAQAQNKPQGQQVRGAALTALFKHAFIISGHSIRYQVDYAHAYLPNGDLLNMYIDFNGTGHQEQGTWRIADDAVCIQLPTVSDSCRRWYQLADGSYENWGATDGMIVSTFHIAGERK